MDAGDIHRGLLCRRRRRRSLYQRLRKPSWIFGPVWTVPYLMMAIAAWLVWRSRGFRDGTGALGIFALQLALNALWSPLFFGLRNP
jgi:benzodiazapine receptor